ncbi:AAA domain-containing protein [Marinilactibacillus kalidii]|uniref:AAA domain-containing protein n=1 Tax=Marinilactibacillus kalidii TaxID=2820274 RepID=UPI001ABE4A2A|nr:DEAD/DEAH box helicase [Marinilactibacillus kalidii]
MNKNQKNILNAWILTEASEPKEISDVKEVLSAGEFENESNQKIKKVQKLEVEKFPWTCSNFKMNEKLAKQKHNYTRQFTLYRFCYPKFYIEKYLKEYFKSKEEIVNKSYVPCYGYSFRVDALGYMVDESLEVPMIHSLLKILSKTSEIENVLENYNHKLALFKEEIKSIVADNPLSKKIMSMLDHKFKELFFVFDSHLYVQEKYFSIEKIKQGVKPYDSSKSYYMNDLELIKERGVNKTLECYMEGIKKEKRVEIDNNFEYIENILAPKNIPDGRWPSPIEHRLSLMQQVAVNQITIGTESIASVNGPPGTGKTTLLKDVFAHLVVERAKGIVQIDKPNEAIITEKLHPTDMHKVPKLKEELSQFKMVVTSSNNGAVENISKELPLSKELIRDIEEDTKFPYYESQYQEAVKELKGMITYSDKLIGNDQSISTWGLFSAVMGKNSNVEKMLGVFLDTNKETPDISKLSGWLIQEYKQTEYNQRMKNWEKAKERFKEELKMIQSLKKEIEYGYRISEKIGDLRQENINDKLEINVIQKEKEIIINEYKSLKKILQKLTEDEPDWKEKISDLEILQEALPKKGIIQKIMNILSNKEDEETQKLKNRKALIIKEKEAYNSKINEHQEKLRQLKENQKDIDNRILVLNERLSKETALMSKLNDFQSKHPDVVVPVEGFWESNHYDEYQESVLWQSDELQFHRGRLFIYAMDLHKHVLIANAHKVQKSLLILANPKKKSIEEIKQAWNIFHLITPVVSTTFASISRMYGRIEADFIDYLFIDEAGQAVPQSAVGALWRSRKAIVVGDPIQIEPVITLEKSLLDEIRKAYNISEHLLGMETSVQKIADWSNPYGTKSNDSWIGIPLWVHRRCLNPMFSIANNMAYEGKMVLPSYVKKAEKSDKKVIGESIWYDVSGGAIKGQYVQEHGETVIELLLEKWKENTDLPSLYIISPFTAVKNELKKKLKQRLIKERPSYKEEIKEWIDRSVGTVHTFQGKEADTVYFVTGTDSQQSGAAKWSCSKPNLLNVAVTRAKEEFVIIGDYNRFESYDYYKDIIKNSEVRKYQTLKSV